MINERALDLGFQEYDRATANGDDELAAFRKGVEAYEAAKPSPWRPIAEIMDAVNWYVIFNDLAFLKYMKYVKRDDKEYWDYVIENYPRAQFMVVNFGEQS